MSDERGNRHAMRIAIVGAGVSGLVAAHLLHARHEIVVFEAAPTPGRAHAHGPGRHGGRDALGRHRLHRLQRPQLPALRAPARRGSASPSQPATMSFGVTDEAGDFEYASTSPNGLFAKRAHLVSPRFHRMVARRACASSARRATLLRSDDDDPSLADWLGAQRFSARVRRAADRPAGRRRLVGRPARRCGASRPASSPSSSTTTGCSSCAGGRAGATVTGGSHRYVEALVAPVPRPPARSRRRCARSAATPTT